MIEFEYLICKHDPSPNATPCDDYYKCLHCKSVLNGVPCDMDHESEHLDTTQVGANGKKRGVVTV